MRVNNYKKKYFVKNEKTFTFNQNKRDINF